MEYDDIIAENPDAELDAAVFDAAVEQGKAQSEEGGDYGTDPSVGAENAAIGKAESDDDDMLEALSNDPRTKPERDEGPLKAGSEYDIWANSRKAPELVWPDRKPQEEEEEEEVNDLYAPPTKKELQALARDEKIEKDLYAPPTTTELRNLGLAPPISTDLLKDPIKEGMDAAFGKMMQGLPSIEPNFSAESSPLTESYYPAPSEINSTPVGKVAGVEIPNTQALMESVLSGLQISNIGLLSSGGKRPEYELKEDAGMVLSIAKDMTTLTADYPSMAAGGLGGGIVATPIGMGIGAVGAGAVGAAGALVAGVAVAPVAAVAAASGAVAGGLVIGAAGVGYGTGFVPALFRNFMVRSYEDKTAENFGDLWRRFSGAALDAHHEGLVMMATLGVAKIIPGLGQKLVSKNIGRLGATRITPAMARMAGNLMQRPMTARVAEVATMVSVGKALEGELGDVSRKDFIHAGLTVTVMHAGNKVAGPAYKLTKKAASDLSSNATAKLLKIFKREGIPPRPILNEAAQNRLLRQEILEPGEQTPRTLKEMTPANDPRMQVEENIKRAEIEKNHFEAEAFKARQEHDIASQQIVPAQDPIKVKELEAKAIKAENDADLAAQRHENLIKKSIADADPEAVAEREQRVADKEAIRTAPERTKNKPPPGAELSVNRVGWDPEYNISIPDPRNPGMRTLIGRLTVDRTKGGIFSFAVRPEYQGKGLGRMLLEAARKDGVDISKSEQGFTEEGAAAVSRITGEPVKATVPVTKEGQAKWLERVVGWGNTYVSGDSKSFGDIILSAEQLKEASVKAKAEVIRSVETPVFVTPETTPAALHTEGDMIAPEANSGLKIEPPAKGSTLYNKILNTKLAAMLFSERGSTFLEVVRPDPVTELEKAQRRIDDKITYRQGRESILARIKDLSWDEIYENVVNRYHGFHLVTKAMLAGSKEVLDTLQDPYKLAILAADHVGKASHWIDHGTLKFATLEVVSPAFKEIIKPFKKEIAALSRHLVSQRTIELYNRGPDPKTGEHIYTGVKIDDARLEVATNGKKYEKVVQQLQDYQNNLLQYLVDAEMLSAESRDFILSQNKLYAPLYRLLEDNDQAGGKKSLQERGAKFRKIKGIEPPKYDADGKVIPPETPESLIIDPIESMVSNTFEYLRLAENNRAMLALVALAKRTELGEAYLKPVKPSLRVTKIDASELFTKKELAEQLADLQAKGFDTSDASLRTFEIFRAFKPDLRKNEIGVWEKGELKVYEVDPMVARAYRAMDGNPKVMHLAFRIATLPAKSLRYSLALTPDFIVRNFFRDQITASVFAKNYSHIPFLDALMSVGSIWATAKHGDRFQEHLKSGGAMQPFVDINQNYIERNVWEINNRTGFFSNAANIANKPFEWIRAGSGIIENATRLAEFERAKAGGANIFEAGYRSREVTVDFARIGALTGSWNMLTAFMNVNIQGLDRTARAFKEDLPGTSLRVATHVTLPSIGIWVWNQSDPERKKIYDGLQPWQKNLFWNIVVHPSLPIVRLPKPFEIGVLFGSLPERALESFFLKEPGAFEDFAGAVVDAFKPPMFPTVGIPMFEHVSGRSSFTHRPLISAYLERQKPEYQYRPETSETAKKIGHVLRGVGLGNIGWDKGPKLDSPEVIENYVRAWSGNAGMYALKAIDMLTGQTWNKNLPEKAFTANPFVKAFFFQHPSLNHRAIDTFYANLNKTTEQIATVRALRQSGDTAAVQRELSRPENVANMTNLTAFAKAMSRHRVLIRMLTDSKKYEKLDSHSKRQQIEQATAAMIVLAEKGNAYITKVRRRLGVIK